MRLRYQQRTALLKTVRILRLVKIETLVDGSVELGSVLGKLRRDYRAHPRWTDRPALPGKLVQIEGETGPRGTNSYT